MHMTREQSRKATLAVLVAAAIVLAAASLMVLLVTPGRSGANPDRPKHIGYGNQSASPSAAPSDGPSTAPSQAPSDGPTESPSPSKSVSHNHEDGDDGGDDGGDDDDDDDDELPRTGTSGPSTTTIVLAGLSVLLLGAGALWLAAALSRRLEGTRLQAHAAGAVAALRRRPSPRPRR